MKIIAIVSAACLLMSNAVLAQDTMKKDRDGQAGHA